MKSRTLVSTLALIASTLAVPAFATPIQSSTAPTSTAGTTINFNLAVPNATPLTSQYSGVSFSGLLQNNDFDGAFPNVVGGGAANFVDGLANITGPGSINFSNVVNSAYFNFVSNPGTTVFSTFLNGVPVETAFLSTGYNGAFTGFQNSAFNSLRIDATATGNGAFLLDNLSFTSGIASAAPEPGTWLMMILGFGTVGFALRRRPKVKTTVNFA